MISVQFYINRNRGRGVVLDNICSHMMGFGEHRTILAVAFAVFDYKYATF